MHRWRKQTMNNFHLIWKYFCWFVLLWCLESDCLMGWKTWGPLAKNQLYLKVALSLPLPWTSFCIVECFTLDGWGGKKDNIVIAASFHGHSFLLRIKSEVKSVAASRRPITWLQHKRFGETPNEPRHCHNVNVIDWCMIDGSCHSSFIKWCALWWIWVIMEKHVATGINVIQLSHCQLFLIISRCFHVPFQWTELAPIPHDKGFNGTWSEISSFWEGLLDWTDGTEQGREAILVSPKYRWRRKMAGRKHVSVWFSSCMMMWENAEKCGKICGHFGRRGLTKIFVSALGKSSRGTSKHQNTKSLIQNICRFPDL